MKKLLLLVLIFFGLNLKGQYTVGVAKQCLASPTPSVPGLTAYPWPEGLGDEEISPDISEWVKDFKRTHPNYSEQVDDVLRCLSNASNPNLLL